MTYADLQRANEATKTTDIGKGKDYVEVNQRIKAFRMICPGGSIETELVSINDGVCIFRAVIRDEAGLLLGTGTAYEKENSSFINKTSYIENCETSAVGRALAMCGIGIDTSVASKEEVENAKLNQDKPETKPKAKAKAETKATAEPKTEAESVNEVSLRTKVIMYFNRHKMPQENVDKICKLYGISNVKDLTPAMCEHYIKALEKSGGNIDE